MKNTYFIKIIFLFVAIFLISKPASVLAVEKYGLKLDPSLQEINIKPGEVYQGTILVTNRGNKEVTLQKIVKDFKAIGEDGAQEFIESQNNDNQNSLSKWISLLGDKTIVLGAEQSQSINYTISIPEGAPAGGYYGAIFFQPVVSGENAKLSILTQVGAIILVNVEGEIKYSAEIIGFQTNKKIYWQNNPKLDFNYRLKNDSSTHIKPMGKIIITNWLGKKTTELDANDQSARLLPGSIRKISSQWQSLRSFGRYSATLELAYFEDQILEKKLTFWILPIPEIILAIISLIFIINSIIHYRQRTFHKLWREIKNRFNRFIHK